MKRLASTTQTRQLPTFGDYRRMRVPEPFQTPIIKEQEILKKAAEDANRDVAEKPEMFPKTEEDTS